MSRWHRTTRPGDAEHLEWLALTDISGPFLTLPVLRQTWPTLDPVDKPIRDALQVAHAIGGKAWIEWVLTGLLEWGSELRTGQIDEYAYTETQHDTTVTPSFVLDDADGDTPRLLGLTLPDGTHPYARIPGGAWPATPVDRIALLCRHYEVPLGLVTDGRWWALVWGARGSVTATGVFDTATWPESADRTVVRAFRSLLHRSRFFAVPDGEDDTTDERLPALFEASGKDQEDVTDALGIQVRRAVEMLVDAIGRADLRDRNGGGDGIGEATAAQVYEAAVSVMMRVVFLFFAEERRLLPADNPIYAAGYSASGLADDLKQRADQGSETELDYSHAAWRRLAALFTAVHTGIDHPRLHLPAYDGSIFNPDRFPWLQRLRIDDRTVLHMLAAVQYVTVGKELRRLSFRALDVEQIGYVYEGLLSFDAYRADQAIVGLIGRAGSEDEVTLTALDAIGPDPAALAERHKASGVGSIKALERRLVPLDAAGRTAALHRLLAVTDGDRDLAERLLPYAGIIRDDLRGLPTVFLPGTLYVTASALRAETGTHYTPRFLAEQVVETALEPLVYEPGPLQTADRDRWKLKSTNDILRLKVADIAMGSGAFLVAACRYLANRLIEAQADEGDLHAAQLRAIAADAPADAEADPLVIDARRKIIQHCLYGVDINKMAVEMAKLSLWLISMDPHRPFTFVDDRLVMGDSLLGFSSTRPFRDLPDLRAERDIAEVLRLRRAVVDLPDSATTAKHELVAKTKLIKKRALDCADLVTGSVLATARSGAAARHEAAARAALLIQRLAAGEPETARSQADQWLRTDLPDAAGPRTPLHWPLEFPEVFEAGGFDAIVGNPPFFGGLKISDSLGNAYREFLVEQLANGVRGTRGTADLVAYFFLQAHRLVDRNGQVGLVATAALATGDTQEVGLGQIVPETATVRAAVKSGRWPSRSAQLQCCQVWTSRLRPSESVTAILDGEPVRSITASLDAESRIQGSPERLAANSDFVFQGMNILGLGFTMAPERAQALIAADSRYADVLFPYLIGQDLNSRPDCSAHRWVINFHDWPEERAAAYAVCYDQVRRLVQPERATNNQRSRRERWWQYSEYRRGLITAIDGLKSVIAITLASSTMMPMMVPNGQVFAHKLGVFATEDAGWLAFLSSAIHYWWAIKYSSPHGGAGDTVYTPDRGFLTLSRPELTSDMRRLGRTLHSKRGELMLGRGVGLTTTYNLVHSAACNDLDVQELRRIHVEIDEAVARAYGWDDLIVKGLDHGFHSTRRGVRFTVGAAVRQEILDRLLEENRQRYTAEKQQLF